MLEQTDGTELPTYQSPNLPFGRGSDWSDAVSNLHSMLKSQEALQRPLPDGSLRIVLRGEKEDFGRSLPKRLNCR